MMRTIGLALMGPLALFLGPACEKKEAPAREQAPAATTGEPTAAPATAQTSQEPADTQGAEVGKAAEPGTPPGQHAAAGEHGHSSPHGGQVAATDAGHLKLRATRDGTFHVWLLDGSLGMRPIDGATATVSVGSGSPVKLAAAGDHLTGKGPRIETDHAKVSVVVTAAGKNEEATFNVDFEDHGGGKAHGGGKGHEEGHGH